MSRSYSNVSLLVGVGSAWLVACSSGEESTQVASPLDGPAVARLEQLADAAVAAGLPGVSVSVTRGEQTVQIARGVADLESRAALTPEHSFRVASMAKSFVAAVTLQLVEEGRLSLDDRLSDWLPGMLPANGEASIENLLRL